MIRPYLARQLLKAACWLYPPVGDVRHVPELIVLASHREARALGFDPQTLRHREYPHMMAYVAGSGPRPLRARSFGRVTVSHIARLRLEAAERDLIRSRMQIWRRIAVWLDL